MKIGEVWRLRSRPEIEVEITEISYMKKGLLCDIFHEGKPDYIVIYKYLLSELQHEQNRDYGNEFIRKFDRVNGRRR